MRVMVLDDTQFVGRHLVEAVLAGGHLQKSARPKAAIGR